MKAKLLLTMTHTDFGGVADHVLTLAGALDPNQFEITVAAAPGGPVEGRLRELNIRFIPVRDFVRPLRLLHDLRAFIQVLSLLKRERFDMVHAHGPKAGFLARVAAWLVGVKVTLYTHHGLVFHPFQSRFKAEFYRRLERLLAKTCNMMFCVSDYNRRALIEAQVAPENQIEVIWNGIDPAPYLRLDDAPAALQALRHELGLAPGDLVVSMVARMEQPKDPLGIIEACAYADPGVPWRLLLVGDGPLRPRAEELARRLGVADRVIFTGFRGDIPQLLGISDLFVLASRSEGLPVSIIEAMMAGKPVVASHVGGNGELVVHGETGMLVPAEDTVRLGQALAALLADPTLRRRMGGAGRARALEFFSVKRMVARTSAVYTALLDAQKQDVVRKGV